MTVGRAAFMALLLLLACTPPGSPAGSGSPCATLTACERAIASASARELPGLIRAYVARGGDARWASLYEALREGPAGAVVLSRTPQRGELALPEAGERDAMLLSLGRAVRRRHLLIADGSASRQLFPADLLAPHLLGLPAVIAAEDNDFAQEIAAARELDTALNAAARFEYVQAAAAADRLRARLGERRTEGALRARFALWLLASAGIAHHEPDDPGAMAPRMSSPYAELLAVQLSRPGHAEAWQLRRDRIIGALPKGRLQALEHMYAPGPCPSSVAPPIEHPSDVAFAAQLALALDEAASPGQPAAPEKLAPAPWLARYEKLVGLVTESGTAWAALPSLLRQRGEIQGLSASGTVVYQQVTGLALKHVAALSALAEAEPARFRTLGAISLAYQPGVLQDSQLAPAVEKLLARSVARDIAAAADAPALFDAALAAFAAGMSFPAQLQGAHFGALRRALGDKLGGSFGDTTGWAMAGLHAANLALGLLLDDPDALSVGARRVARALATVDTEAPLAQLVAAAARYAQLARSGVLDPQVLNPALLSPDRRAARKALGQAMAALAEPGPVKPAEKELLAQLTELADGLIAAMAADPGDTTAVQCTGDGAIAKGSPLRDAFDRLQKKRRALLDNDAFARGDGAWISRARLLGLVASDLLDVTDRRAGVLTLAIDDARASQIVNTALGGWFEPAGAGLGAGTYLFARGLLQDRGDVAANGVRALRAMGELFGERGGLFATLASVGAKLGETDAAGDVLVRYARGAYESDAADQGDLLLMLHLAAAVARDRSSADDAVALARERGRPVYLPLLMYATSTDGKELAGAMRDATKAGCAPPDPRVVIAVDGAIADFVAGRRGRALEGLAAVLAAAEDKGLTVPRQRFRYEQTHGGKAFYLEQSVSFARRYLRGSSRYQVGMGLSSRMGPSAAMTVSFADAASADAAREAARYYAHVALLRAVYLFVEGRETEAVGAARLAVDAWVQGVLLGDASVPALADPIQPDQIAWPADATATLVIAGQQAADLGQIFLAGDLWTLAKAGLGRAAGDDAVAQVLATPPPALTGVAELEPVLERARKSLEVLAGPLPCTAKQGDVEPLLRVRCERYPTALALRTADSLPALPRLKSGPGTAICGGYRALDAFLAAKDQQRYEPDLLVASVEALRQESRFHDAASVLARHRRPSHCNETLVEAARDLGAREELGIHVRADLLSVAANCASGTEVDADLLALDELTLRHPLPSRNFEVLLFAIRIALEDDRWAPLHTMTHRTGFIQRWHRLGPDLALSALLVQHAAAVGLGKAPDVEGTAAFYQLLCTTFPAKQRGALCNTIGLLRESGPPAEKKRVSRKALADLMKRATASP